MKILPPLYVALLFLLLGSTVLVAQTGDVRGFVYDQETGEPVIFTNVFLEKTTHAATTDINGFYSINKVPAGDYVLVSTFIGYDTTRLTVKITAGQILNQKLFVKKSNIILQEVEVSAKREEKETEVRTSAVKITPKQITKLPSIGGEPDLAQYLQVLPGIVSTGDQGGQLYIRGGSPIQTKVLLDGITIYNPFHSLGLFSVIETDLLRNVEVMTGGYGANYSGRISAVIDATTRDGNKGRLAGKVSANTFMAKAVLEGPIIKLKDDGNAKGGLSGSYILTGKTSYLDRTSPKIYEYVDSTGLPYSFTDFYGKISLTSDNGSKWNLSGFNFKDNAKFKNVSDFGWNSWGMGSSFVIVPGQSKIVIDGFFSYSNYDISLEEADNKPRTSSIGGFNGGINFSYYLPKGDLKYGLEVNGFSTTFDFYNPVGIKIEENQYTTEMGAFVKYKGNLLNNKLIVEPGLRFNYYASLSAATLEPRLGLKYNASKGFRLKASGGYYTQNFISTKSDRDIVNLFTGFLSGPDAAIKNTEGQLSANNLQTAWHGIAGFEVDLLRHLDLNVEGYYKRFSQLIELNRNKLFSTDPTYAIEVGDAYGLDLLVKYDYKRWFLWGAYSYAFVKRDNGEQIYPTNFDRRHNLNLLASYTMGRKKDWEFSIRWNLGSGFPFTLTQGFYEALNLNNGIDVNYTQQNGNLGVLLDDKINAGRLPYYHRLDASIHKEFALSRRAKLELNAGVTNAYNRDNIFYVDRITNEKIFQLPLLPSFGVGFSF